MAGGREEELVRRIRFPETATGPPVGRQSSRVSTVSSVASSAKGSCSRELRKAYDIAMAEKMSKKLTFADVDDGGDYDSTTIHKHGSKVTYMDFTSTEDHFDYAVRGTQSNGDLDGAPSGSAAVASSSSSSMSRFIGATDFRSGGTTSTNDAADLNGARGVKREACLGSKRGERRYRSRAQDVEDASQVQPAPEATTSSRPFLASASHVVSGSSSAATASRALSSQVWASTEVSAASTVPDKAGGAKDIASSSGRPTSAGRACRIAWDAAGPEAGWSSVNPAAQTPKVSGPAAVPGPAPIGPPLPMIPAPSSPAAQRRPSAFQRVRRTVNSGLSAISRRFGQ